KLGDYQSSTRFLNRGLDSVETFWPGNRQMLRNCSQLSQVLAARNLTAAAEGYAREMLRLASDQKDPEFASVSYVRLGLILAKRQQRSEAMEMLRRGLDVPAGAWSKAYALLQLGELHNEAGEWQEAIAAFNQSISTAQSAPVSVTTERSDGKRDGGVAEATTDRFPAILYSAHKGKM